jgi:hypothetical protein
MPTSLPQKVNRINSDAKESHTYSPDFWPTDPVFIGSGPDHFDPYGTVPCGRSRDSGLPHSAGFDLRLRDSTEAVPVSSALGLPFLVRLGLVLVSMGLLVSLAGIVALPVLVLLALVVLDLTSLDLLSRACRPGRDSSITEEWFRSTHGHRPSSGICKSRWLKWGSDRLEDFPCATEAGNCLSGPQHGHCWKSSWDRLPCPASLRSLVYLLKR